MQTVDLNTGTAPWWVQPLGGGGPNEWDQRVQAPPPLGPPALAVPVGGLPATWTSLSPAQWVQHPAGSAVGNYEYTLRILVPNCTIAATVMVSGKFSADNSATLQVNSNPPILAPGAMAYQNSFTLPPTQLVLGMNTIKVQVTNLHGPTGFLFSGTVTNRCPRELEQPGQPGDPRG